MRYVSPICDLCKWSLGGQTFHVTVTIRSDVKNEEQEEVYELYWTKLRTPSNSSKFFKKPKIYRFMSNVVMLAFPSQKLSSFFF